METNRLYMISVLGLDRPGIVAEFTEILAEANVNIVDIDQTVMRKLFTMFLIADPATSKTDFVKVKEKLLKKANELGMKISVEPYVFDESLRRKEERKLILVTIIGRDRPGIVARFSAVCAENNANIERTKMVARGETIAMEFLLDSDKLKVDFDRFKESFHKLGLELNLSIIIQRQDIFRKAKKLIVFDLDTTFIEQEIIDEIAKLAGIDESVRKITEKAMEGKMSYRESLKERVRLLRGLPASALDKILKEITLTKGVEDVLQVMKELGCKIAIVTGSFSYFTDKIKEKYGIDYVFANELMVKDGRLTGEVKEPIIDAEMKRKLIQDIMAREGIKREEVIAVGDGANDRFMLMEAGVGIAFNAKEVVRKIADGVVSKENMRGLIYCLTEFRDY